MPGTVQTSEVYVAIHAGSTESWDENQAEQNVVQAALKEVAESAKKSLSEGHSAEEVVKSAVASLKSKYSSPSYGAVAVDIQGALAAEGSKEGSFTVSGDVALASSDILPSQTVSSIKSLGRTLHSAIEKHAEKDTKPLGVIALGRDGTIAIESTARLFLTASASSSTPAIASVVESTIHLFPQHIFYDSGITAGLVRYPIAPGQTAVFTPGKVPIMDLSRSDFVQYMELVRKISVAACRVTKSTYAGLVANGGSYVTILPFPGLTPEKLGEDIHSDALEYYPLYPGYLSSKNGPKMTSEFLTSVTSKITAVTGLTDSFDRTFFGDTSDNDLMAKLIRGDLSQHRFWENSKHAAMVSPKGKVPGYSIVVPRTHLRPDIFNLEDQEYADLCAASHDAAQALKNGLGVKRVGLFYEGFEGYYAHTKLIPIHDPTPAEKEDITVRDVAPYSDNYQGYLTTQLGPMVEDLGKLQAQAAILKAEIKSKKLL